MGRIHTIVCIVFVGFLALIGPQGAASAEEAERRTEPLNLEEIIAAAPSDILILDIMALPEAERTLWIKASMMQMVQSLVARDETYAQCVLDWYFGGGSGPLWIETVMQEYPHLRPAAAFEATAKQVCSER